MTESNIPIALCYQGWNQSTHAVACALATCTKFSWINDKAAVDKFKSLVALRYPNVWADLLMKV